MKTSRRKFFKSVGGTLVASGISACSEKPNDQRYNQSDIELLKTQQVQEAQLAGKNRFGVHQYRGYRGLAELPWFNLDSDGKLYCSDPSVPASIDIHCHLGMSVLFEPYLDLHIKTDRVRHLLDCDQQNPGCDLELDKYINSNFTEDALDTLESTIRSQGLWGNDYSESQTIPNLLAEMDSMRVEKTAILPIKLGLWFGDNQTETWRKAVEKPAYESRLIAGFSIHPRDSHNIEYMRAYANSKQRNTVKLMKLHPTVQRFFPDEQAMMDLYAEAERLGVTVFFHGGRAGIEPESSHQFALPRHYEAVFANFPDLNIIVGHAGARDNEAMLKLAKKYSNVWMDIHGQSISRLDEMIKTLGGERLLFGTDWPFYHIGASLAKVLITTQNERPEVRKAILRDNALKVLELI